MSVVKINALEVPDQMAGTLEERFRNRAGEVEKVPGFQRFQLLRPTDDSDRWFVVTWWDSEEAFESWLSSDAFSKGHAQSAQHGPAATGSELLSFEVVLDH